MNKFNIDSLDKIREHILKLKNDNLGNIRESKHYYEDSCVKGDSDAMKVWAEKRKKSVQKDQEYNIKLSEIKDLKRRLYNRDFSSLLEKKIREKLGEAFFNELREEVLREMYNDEQELNSCLEEIFTPDELGLVNN